MSEIAAVDPLSLQVFANLFASVAEEMGVTLQRSSYSPNIKMRRDYSCALFDAEGRLLAQAAHMPVHLGAMPMAMDAVRARYTLDPRDVIILNDPYAGGTHLPDISLVSPAYSGDGTLLGYVMSRAHHADIGGMSPGSMPISSEIFGEGVIIPPVHLVRAGVLQEGVLELILRNIRTPEERRGDLQAQRAAQGIGEAGLAMLAERYGASAVSAHGVALQAYAERAMRATIDRIPPGDYAAQDYLDNDGASEERVPIAVVIGRQAQSTDLSIDFTGSAAQRPGPINAPLAVTISAALYVLRCLGESDVPVNAGSLRPLWIVAPPGTVVSAVAPAAVAGGNVETSQRIVDVVFAALAPAFPGRVPAASQGTMNNLAFGGYDAERGRHFAYYETMGGGLGGRPGGPGPSGLHDHMSNTMNTPVEVLESEYPVRVERYALRRHSGGAGRHHGGDGLERDLRFLTSARVTLLSERRTVPPYGLSGGAPGKVGRNRLVTASEERVLPGKAQFDVLPGDLVSVHTPGGGGLKVGESGC